MPKKKVVEKIDCPVPKSASEQFMEDVEIPLSAKFIASTPKLELVKPRVKGNDSIMSISVETAQGKIDIEFTITGFCGNVPAPKRSAEGLRTMFREIFIKEFGGHIK